MCAGAIRGSLNLVLAAASETLARDPGRPYQILGVGTVCKPALVGAE